MGACPWSHLVSEFPFLLQLAAGFMSVSSLLTPSLGSTRRRYAIVGLGSRHQLYQDAIESTHAGWAELVAVCDSNPGRVALARRRSVQNGAAAPAGYVA